MSWSQRLFGMECASQTDVKDAKQATEERMGPGLTGEYDMELREKAGLHTPPPPPEFMGLEGEYDQSGLAKRVAAAFDQDPNLDDIETVEVSQSGSTIIFRGSVPDHFTLGHLTDVAARVDGTKAVDTTQIIVIAG